MSRSELHEKIVIYRSPPDGGWVAHGLRTDQVGIAASPVDALAQLIRLVHALLDESAIDQSIEILRAAPEEIRKMAEVSTPLPKEIVEVAHWKAVGKWPQDWEIQGPGPEGESFVAEVEESCIA